MSPTCLVDGLQNSSNFSDACFHHGHIGDLGFDADVDAITSFHIFRTLGMMVFRTLCFTVLCPWALATIAAILTWLTGVIPKLIRERNRPTNCLPESVWTIHGKKYDLSKWTKNHPGGEWAIDLGRNRDCTGLFESYHVFADQKKLAKVLARFEIKSDESAASDTGENSTGLVFNDAFHEDVKAFVRNHFKGKSHYMKPWVACLFVFLWCFQVYIMYLFLQGSYLAIWLLPTIGWLFTCNVAHDGSHFAVSKHPWLNSIASCTAMPTHFPSTCWHIQHVIQHHVYTNDEDDVDLYHFLPVVRVTKLTEWVNRFKLQWLSVFFVLPTTVGHLMFIVPMDLLSGFVDMVTGTKRYEECENLEDFVDRHRGTIWIEFLFCASWAVLVLSTCGMADGLFRLGLSYGIGSMWFIIISQGAHLQESSMVGKEDPSWAKRQVRTSMNFATDSLLWWFLTGGLNMQSLHHVCPVIHNSHLADLWPEYKQLCKKHGVEIVEAKNIFSFFRGFLSWVAQLAQEDLGPSK